MASRVLIAHDSPVARLWVKNALRRFAAECVEVDSGSALEGRLREASFDMIVIRTALPGAPALQLLASLGCPILVVHEIRGHHAMVALDLSGLAERIVVSEKAFAELVEDRLQRRSGTELSSASARASGAPPASTRGSSGPPSRRLG